jgi:hypothetical protein
MGKIWLMLLSAAVVGQAADVCNVVNLLGPYAFQISGMTDVSGTPQPTVGLGKVVLDGSGGFPGTGNLSGTSSVMLSGFLLGNPVTGSYVANPDCGITWQLQDDSGAYQHFAGKLSPDLMRAPFRQTDKGGASGILEKIPDSCNSSDLQKKYSFTVSGVMRVMQPGGASSNVNAHGTLDTTREGNFQVDGDCTVHWVLHLTPDSPVMNMRGFLVNKGREILGFQTDPGAMVAARLTVDEQ